VVLEELGDCVSGQADVERAYEYRELVAAINAFLGTLSWEKRCIFIRRYWFTDSVEEIAARFQMSRPAVSMTLTRMRGKLREYLAERGFDV
jgi:RNA polymerase sigma-70 factor (ECF subfamily)